jgi:hypothetical protein
VARIKIEDLPKEMEIGAEELRRIRGGGLVMEERPSPYARFTDVGVKSLFDLSKSSLFEK